MADVGSPNLYNLVYGQLVYLDSRDASVAYRDVFAFCMSICITSGGRVFQQVWRMLDRRTCRLVSVHLRKLSLIALRVC